MTAEEAFNTKHSVQGAEEEAFPDTIRGMQRDVGGKRHEDWAGCTDCELNYSFCIFTRVWPGL